MLGTQEIIIIAIIILILFGGKRIPELMKGLGKGVRYFKDSVNGVDAPEEQHSSKDKPVETQHDEPTR
jgi:twin arginine-targeting protein translocase, tatA/E family